jgi:FMN phosphatase YigB (HAD superfamily)
MSADSPTLGRSQPIRAVTFDCWSTLIVERDRLGARERRIDQVMLELDSAGAEVRREQLEASMHDAWRRHLALWRTGVSTGAEEMAGWTLAGVGLESSSVREPVARIYAENSLDSEIVALNGARATLEALAASGVRRALICDTGFSPGSVVRQLLDRVGLLELLEVTIFSNEIGVPKPDGRVFRAALDPFGVSAAEAVHVGDLRRTDVAGARAAGMASVRISDHNDDRSELADADAVAESHAHLCALLSLPRTPAL